MSETNPYEGKALVMRAQTARRGLGLLLIRHGGGSFGLTVDELKKLGAKVEIELIRRNDNGDIVGEPKLFSYAVPCSELEPNEIAALVGAKAWDSGRSKIIPVAELVDATTATIDASTIPA